MEQEWSTVVFDLLPYKDTGTYTLKWPDETLQLLDDHLVTIQNMSLSPYKKPFESYINAWERKLRMAQVHTCTHTRQIHEVAGIASCYCFSVSYSSAVFFWFLQDALGEWLVCQHGWLNLEPIFCSDDINQQLPVEGNTYKQFEQQWKSILKYTVENNKVKTLNFCILGHSIKASHSNSDAFLFVVD